MSLPKNQPLTDRTKPTSVCFVFTSTGIGGAERSMLRLLAYAYPHTLDCSVILASKGNSELAEALGALGVPVYQISGLNILGLARHLTQTKPDILYLFGVLRSLLPILAGKLAAIPTIIGAERSSVSRHSDRIVRRFDQYLLNGYICNSACAVDVLHNELGIARDRLHIVYNGIDKPDQTIAAAPFSADKFGKGPFIVCVANLRELKGQHILLQAIRQLQEEFPQARAILVGKDFSQGAFFKQAAAQGLADTYHWVGFMKDVRPYLKAATIFVLPSLYLEGTPTSILEAMLLGIPVVASDIGGISELIKDNETGMLVEPGNPKMLAEKIRTLLLSATFRQDLSKKAQQHVLKNHSMARMLEGHQKAFDALGFRNQLSAAPVLKKD